MKRREFLLVSAGAGGAVAASGQVAGQEQSSGAMSRVNAPGSRSLFQEDTNDESAVEVIEVGDNFYDPEEVTIEVGTTVRWVWIGSINHDVTPTSQPDGADWEGHPDLISEGEYEFTFEVPGTYEYTCTPHPGMDGVIEVVEDIDDVDTQPLPPGQQPIDPDEIGVPLQKHYIGIATFLAIFLTLIFTFYVLKYGETPHSGYPGDK